MSTIINSEYYFRNSHSTADAAITLKKLELVSMSRSQFFTTVNIDIQNAFKTMPWQYTLVAFTNAKVSKYLFYVVRIYLDSCIRERERAWVPVP